MMVQHNAFITANAADALSFFLADTYGFFMDSSLNRSTLPPLSVMANLITCTEV